MFKVLTTAAIMISLALAPFTGEITPESDFSPIIEEKVVEIVQTPENFIDYSFIANVSAYCPCEKCCGKTDKVTASGTIAKANYTIAAPANIPFGTKIMILDTVYTVEDRGGAIKGNKIDIYFDTHEEALEFGRQQLYASVLKDIK